MIGDEFVTVFVGGIPEQRRLCVRYWPVNVFGPLGRIVEPEMVAGEVIAQMEDGTLHALRNTP